MPTLSELKSTRQVHTEDLRDPEVQAESERTALAVRVIRYRTEHGPSQSALARQLGMRQPAIARLVAGDHEPSLATLAPVAWNHSWCECRQLVGFMLLLGWRA
jgi:DNA-binding XRE family transcriptional regulator